MKRLIQVLLVCGLGYVGFMAWTFRVLREKNPVIQAVFENDAVKVKTILRDRPELVNVQSHKLGNRTALWYAVSFNFEDVAMVLLEHGADPNMRDKTATAEAPIDLINPSDSSRSNLLFQLAFHGGKPGQTNLYSQPLMQALEHGLRASLTNELSK